MGFLSSRNGDDFSEACRELAGLGYWLDCFTVNAKHFTPQSRPRLFIVACKKSNLPEQAVLHRNDMVLSPWPQAVKLQNHIRTKKIVNALLDLSIPTGLFCLPVQSLPPVNNSIQQVIDREGGDWWAGELERNPKRSDGGDDFYRSYHGAG